MNNQIKTIGSLLLEEYMKGYNVGFKEGKADEQLQSIEDAKQQAAEYLNALDKEKEQAYQQGAREFAEWLCRKSDYTDIDINGFVTCRCGDSPRDTTIEQALAEWQEGADNECNIR